MTDNSGASQDKKSLFKGRFKFLEIEAFDKCKITLTFLSYFL